MHGWIGGLSHESIDLSMHGCSIHRSCVFALPALVAERLTDAIAVLILAAVSVGTYAEQLDSRSVFGVEVSADGALWVIGGVILAGLLVLSWKRLSFAILALLHRVPVVGRVAPKLEEMYRAMVTCLAPVPLLYTVVLSLIAWGAECWGFQIVLQGLGVEQATLSASTFIYAFATVAGGPSPGGLGIADGALVGMTTQLIGTTEAVAVTGALLVRIATLWFGVGMGAVALLGFEKLLQDGLPDTSTGSDPGADEDTGSQAG